jgi:hypothetical protein
MKITKRQLRRIIKEQLQVAMDANQGMDVNISVTGPGGYDGEILDETQGSLFNPADLLKMADFLDAAQKNPNAELIVYEVD